MFKFFPIPYSRCNCKCKALAFSLCNLVTFMPNYDGNVLKYKNDNLLSEIFLSNFALSPQLSPKWILYLVACQKALGSVFLLIYLKINDLVLGKIGNDKSEHEFNSLKWRIFSQPSKLWTGKNTKSLFLSHWEISLPFIIWLTLTGTKFLKGPWVSGNGNFTLKLALGKKSLASRGLIFGDEDISIPEIWPIQLILYFSYWAWSTPWGNVLSLKTFRQILVLSWTIRYSVFQPVKFANSLSSSGPTIFSTFRYKFRYNK